MTSRPLRVILEADPRSTWGARGAVTSALQALLREQGKRIPATITVPRFLSTHPTQYRSLYMKLLERCRMLERGIVAGKKAERFTGEDDGQLSMQLLGMLMSGEEPLAGGVDVEEFLPELEDVDDAEAENDPHDPAPPRPASASRDGYLLDDRRVARPQVHGSLTGSGC